jgi:hypothetical protein
MVVDKTKVVVKVRALVESRNANLNTLSSGLTTNKLVLMTYIVSRVAGIGNFCRRRTGVCQCDDSCPRVELSLRQGQHNAPENLSFALSSFCGRLAELLDLKLKDQTLKDTQQACREGQVKLEPEKLFEQECKAWIGCFVDCHC